MDRQLRHMETCLVRQLRHNEQVARQGKTYEMRLMARGRVKAYKNCLEHIQKVRNEQRANSGV